MQHLILEAAELLDNLLALSLLLSIIGAGNSLVDVVDGAGLRNKRQLERQILEETDRSAAKGASHKNDRPSHANGFASEGLGVAGDRFGCVAS